MDGGSVLLIEDIDRYFGQEQVDEAKSKISYSSFINEISGVKAREDVILIITTNHKSKLDEALLRSGRLDRHFEIGLPGEKEIREYLSWFFGVDIVSLPDVENLTMADVENVCVRNRGDVTAALNQLKINKSEKAILSL
jgi:SpoVK/Ycf46/Vps4 family AAA+-type ATPase